MDIVLELVSKYPLIASVLLVIGGCRVVLKPLMSVLRSLAIYTPTPKDDEILDKVEDSKVYKGVVWVLDYLFSLKLIK